MFSPAVGREEHCKQILLACVGSANSVLAALGLPPLMVCVLSCFYTSQALGCSSGELSEAGPGLCAVPRSKPLRFRFLGTPQRRRLGWTCILCPSQVRAAQVTRCLASSVSPGGARRLITSSVPVTQFPGCTAGALSQVGCVS